MKKYLLILSLLFAAHSFAQKGYGKVDAGAEILKGFVKPSGAITIGLMPAKGFGVGAKMQYVKDFGFIAMADLRAIVPTGTNSLSAGFNLGWRFDKSESTGAFGINADIIIGNKKVRPFLSIGGLYLKQNKPPISYNFFYVGTGFYF